MSEYTNLNPSGNTGFDIARATSATSEVAYDRQIPFRIDECTYFEFEAQSSSSDNEVAIFVECVLLKNPWGRD
jgi:hypothetical protein